ncbi:hypothetical protein V9K67_10410 [Paraflavisolibacter sp. H34]|uniref:hypothetical protein n=1 Tax=Huijunlia imazamoxiresistens TaxID=3127457 RepID=UPI00301A3702
MKKVIVFLLVVVGVVLAAYLLFLEALAPAGSMPAVEAARSPVAVLDPKPRLMARLKDMVTDGSKGLYRLSLDDLQVDVAGQSVTLVNVSLQPDSAVLARLEERQEAPDDVVALRLRSFRVDGLGLSDLLTRKTIDLDTLRLLQPELTVYHRKQPYNSSRKDSLTLQQRLAKHLERFSVKKIIVQEGSIVHQHLARGQASRFTGLDIRLTDLLIDSTTRDAKDRFLFAKDASLSFRNYSMPVGGKLYRLTLGAVRLDAARRQLTVRDLSFTPRYSKERFARAAGGHRKERYRVTVSRLRLQQVDWQRLLREDGLSAAAVTISRPRVAIYLDRTLPPSPSRKAVFPHQLLMQLPFPVEVPRVEVENGEVVYEERSPQSGQTASIRFDRIRGQVRPLSNRPKGRKRGAIVCTAGARVQGVTPLEARFRFDLSRHRQGAFSVAFDLGAFDGALVNSFAEPLGLMSVKSGRARRLEARLDGNNRQASGKVLLLYDDLHISALKKGEEGELKKKRLFSKLANVLVIKDHNPSGDDPPRAPECVYQKEPGDSFFNLIWKTVLTGMLKTIGAPEKLAK